MSKIQVGPYQLENDVEVKVIMDGYEIFPTAVQKHFISPENFTDAQWIMEGGIIVYDE